MPMSTRGVPATSRIPTNRAASGLSWWSAQAPTYGVSVTFSVSYYSSTSAVCQQGYEPILHPSSDDSLWISAIMANLGYTSGSAATRVASFNSWLRATNSTDWAYSVFVCYNPPGTSSTFTDGYFAYTYDLGGPYVQMLFDLSRNLRSEFNTSQGPARWVVKLYSPEATSKLAQSAVCEKAITPPAFMAEPPLSLTSFKFAFGTQMVAVVFGGTITCRMNWLCLIFQSLRILP